MNQNQRNRAMQNLRNGRVRLLVATDVAARGLDVNGITHVFNFDLPKNPEDYVHRIGRTGRAGAKGIAISFAGPEDRRQLRDIERYTKQPIEAKVVEGFEPKTTPSRDFSSDRPRPNGQHRKPSHHRGQKPSGSHHRHGQSDSRKSGYQGASQGARHSAAPTGAQGEANGKTRNSSNENRSNTRHSGFENKGSSRFSADRRDANRGQQRPQRRERSNFSPRGNGPTLG